MPDMAALEASGFEVHAKGAMEVARLSNFARLSKQLAALAQTVSEVPEIAEAKRMEACQVHEQSLALASAGGVRVPSAAMVESVQQEASGTKFITSEVARMAGEVREVRENLAGHTAEFNHLASEMRERFRETAQRLDSCGQWRQGVDDLRREVEGGAERFARSEAERLQATQLESHLMLEGRIEELHGISRAQDTENSKNFNAVESRQMQMQMQIESSMAILQRHDGFPELARKELQKAVAALEENISECRRRLDAEKLALQEEVQKESQTLTDKQSRAVVELHRQIRACEKGLRESKKEQEEAHDRVWRHVDTSRASVEEQIQQRCESLQEAVCAKQKLTVLGQEEVAATARRYTDEARDAVLPKIEQAARLAETSAKELAQRLAEELRVELATKAHELAGRIDGATSASEAISARLAAATQRSDERLDDAFGNLLQKLESQQAEIKEEVQCVRLEAAHACEGLASHTASQFDYHQTHMTEQSSILRHDVDRSVSSLQKQFAEVREDLRADLQQEAANVRQLSSAQEAQHSSDIGCLRDVLLEEVRVQARRITQVDERIRAKLAEVTEDSQRSHEAQGRVLQDARESLNLELHRLLGQAQHSLRDIVASEFKRVEVLEGSLSKAGAEHIASQRRTEDAIEVLKADLELVREQALAAQSQARSVEAATRQCSDSIGQLRDAEMRSQVGSLEELRCAIGSLTNGLMKVAQCCGFIGGLEEGRHENVGGEPMSQHLSANRIGIKELVIWEQSGMPLVSRIEASWAARCSARAGTLLELVQQKADMTALNMVQAAVRDLDVRSFTSNRAANSAALRAWRESSAISKDVTTAMCVRVGQPFVGAYGSHARKICATGAIAAGPAQACGDVQRCLDSIGTTASCASLVSLPQRSDTMSVNPSASIDEGAMLQPCEPSDQAGEPGPRPPGPAPLAEGPLQRRVHGRNNAASGDCAPKSDVQP